MSKNIRNWVLSYLLVIAFIVALVTSYYKHFIFLQILAYLVLGLLSLGIIHVLASFVKTCIIEAFGEDK